MALTATRQAVIAWYKASQWERLRQLVCDKETFNIRYEDWEYSASQEIRRLEQRGIRVRKVEIDAEALKKWAFQQGRRIDAVTRQEFANRQLASASQ